MRTCVEPQCYGGPNSMAARSSWLLAEMPYRLSWRTLGVACVILGGFALWSLYFNTLPLWLSAPLGSVLLTWYGSLQHETIHGHPTRSRRLNSVIGGFPLSL